MVTYHLLEWQLPGRNTGTMIEIVRPGDVVLLSQFNIKADADLLLG